MITYFKHLYDTGTPYVVPINKALERIKNGQSKTLIDKIRKAKTKDEKDKLKKSLPSICFSGEFSERNAKGLLNHSGFICLDFDNVDNIEEMKQKISEDKYTYSCFISPTGTGLKSLVKIPKEPENQGLFYDSLCEHFKEIEADKQCKDVSRVCFESYDPNIYINESSELWESKVSNLENDVYEAPKIQLNDESEIIEKLRIWADKNHPITQGQRNANLFKFAAACNCFGVNESFCEYYCLHNFKTSDFGETEIKTTVKSAYKNRSEFNTKFFEDSKRINTAKNLIRSKKKDVEIINILKSSGVDEETAKTIIDEAKEQTSGNLTKFWTVEKTKQGIKYDLIRLDFIHFLNQHGFYKLTISDKDYIFIRVKNNVLKPVEIHHIKKFVFDYVIEYYESDIYEFMARGVKAYFNKELFELLPLYNYKPNKSDNETSFFYFNNGVLKVNKKGYELIDYIDLDGYVWESHIIKRDWLDKKVNKSDFNKFIDNVAGKTNKARLNAFYTSIGFLLHNFKDRSFSPCIILNDEKISDNPEGGTGKGIFMKGISNFQRSITIDGKGFKFDKSFIWQRVNLDTQIINFEDVNKGFDFERLFSVITEGITVEKKGLHEFYIPFEDSPKVCITTNYAVKGNGNSFERRKFELEFAQVYSKDFTPLDEFGKIMFDEWSEEEWLSFDRFMIDCVVLFLDNGLMKYEHVNLSFKKLVSETCNEFVDFMEVYYKENERIKISSLKDQYLEQYPERTRYTTTTSFNKYLHEYAKYKGSELLKKSSNGVYFVEFIKYDNQWD